MTIFDRSKDRSDRLFGNVGRSRLKGPTTTDGGRSRLGGPVTEDGGRSRLRGPATEDGGTSALRGPVTADGGGSRLQGAVTEDGGETRLTGATETIGFEEEQLDERLRPRLGSILKPRLNTNYNRGKLLDRPEEPLRSIFDGDD